VSSLDSLLVVLHINNYLVFDILTLTMYKLKGILEVRSRSSSRADQAMQE
jgi:hypothetical protein